jgi:hypothetical protein
MAGSLNFGSDVVAMGTTLSELVMPDKLWAHLIVPPVLMLVWLWLESPVLNLAHAGGELDKARARLNWYGSALLLAVMYVIWLHAELEPYRRVWVRSFTVAAIPIALIGASRREEGQLLNSSSRRALMFWLGANVAGRVIVSIFWFYGDLQESVLRVIRSPGFIDR